MPWSLRSVHFTDVTANWAKAAVFNLASRMIINGVDSTHFSPDTDITRAQFAAIIVRALGLPSSGNSTTGNSASFTDIPFTAWYYDAVEEAKTYGIIRGYAGGTFRPNQTITREEAMVMIDRAANLAGVNSQLTKSNVIAALSGFTTKTKLTIGLCLQLHKLLMIN